MPPCPGARRSRAGPRAATTATRAAVVAVVDSALLHINRGDLIALSDLMIPEAMVFPAQDRDGRGRSYTVRTVASQRATGKRAPIIERGYDPIVRLSGTIASVWMPYDLWAGGTWSHGGIDLLTLVQVGSAWRIANFTYTIEQPPGAPAPPLPRAAPCSHPASPMARRAACGDRTTDAANVHPLAGALL